MNQTEIIRADCLASSRKRYILKAQAEGSVDMAENAINMNIHMDADLRAKEDAVFTELSVNSFEVKLEQLSEGTIASMLEAERIGKDLSVKGYNDLDELFADLKK